MRDTRSAFLEWQKNQGAGAVPQNPYSIDPKTYFNQDLQISPVESIQMVGSGQALSNLGIAPESIGESYTKNMSLGADGKLYSSGLTDQTNNSLASQRVMEGPTQANADLLKGAEEGDWGYKQWGTAGNIGLGVGQLGLGIASYFENKKTAEAQRKLLGQQYENNADLISARKAKRANISSAFSGGN